VGGRRIAAGIWFDDGETLFFYNAVSTRRRATCRRAWSWSPAPSRWRWEAGRSRFDFLRGDESYKYGWGAQTCQSSGLAGCSNEHLR